ncbi:DUF5681 domain-containing protein [Bradyrhizobium sp. URHA0013]|uniref:DUF5681 domain-containing protein n=1 Tax=Bradyrhizobium sp. URHA0013 TaxID=1380352 RepID=UPI003527D6C1
MNKQVASRWKPGQSGNPLGRPQGTRSKFSEQACADALADWTSNGASVLERVRATDPSTYLRVLPCWRAAVLPGAERRAGHYRL